jgi:hypothetical protein
MDIDAAGRNPEPNSDVGDGDGDGDGERGNMKEREAKHTYR